VVGNADICGNVMLTSGSSAEQRFRYATTASTTTTSGGCGSGCGRKRECWGMGITENVFVGGKMI
jgi:hypothetical protein